MMGRTTPHVAAACRRDSAGVTAMWYMDLRMYGRWILGRRPFRTVEQAYRARTAMVNATAANRFGVEPRIRYQHNRTLGARITK
jgi:hypothetical protein